MTYKAIIVKLAQEHDLTVWREASKYAFQYRHTITASHDDTVGLLTNGRSDSFAKIVDPHLPSQQATISVLNSLGLNWEPLKLTGDFIFTHWPTEYRYVTQRFGVNPQIYNQYGLPGHEGVDVRATTNSKIFAVADGVVSDINYTDNGHNYGIFVRVLHNNLWETTYAHLAQVKVYLGQQVNGGDLVGLADSTGNSTASHLHLTLKNKDESFTDENGVTWPYNIWNPEPFMQHFADVYWPPLPEPEPNNVAIGLHLRADPTRSLSGEWAEVERLRDSGKPKIIKLLHAHPEVNFVDAATKLGADATYIVRIFQSGWNRTVSPNDFVNWNIDELLARIATLHNYNVPYENIYVEIHNEPNLRDEGWNEYNWADGGGFANWLKQVATILRQRLPFGVKLMYPGLSPGETIGNVRYAAKTFFDQSRWTLTNLDALGIHTYWQVALNNMGEALAWVDWNDEKTTKPIFITEASIVDRPAIVSPTEYGKRYADYVKLLDNVAGITFFVASASNNYFAPETWVAENNIVKGIGESLVNNL